MASWSSMSTSVATEPSAPTEGSQSGISTSPSSFGHERVERLPAFAMNPSVCASATVSISADVGVLPEAKVLICVVCGCAFDQQR